MAKAGTGHAPIEIAVTPRFEIFYALQALESGSAGRLDHWRRGTEARLPARLRTDLAGVAPSPLIWPLLADALREEPGAITFPEMMQALRAMDGESFQRSVLSGVFKKTGAVAGLISGKTTLADTVKNESATQERLLTLLGLHPFSKSSVSAASFKRLVSSAASYRDEVVSVLESFWNASFSDTWERLEPQMRKSASRMKHELDGTTFESFSADKKLPVTVDSDAVVTVRNGARFPLKSVAALTLIPSAFNAAKLWATYTDSQKRQRYYIPVLDTNLEPDPVVRVDASAVFKALGDTTRYAMAALIARAPMTSVELARAFSVSKPTISHHVHQLRAAGLIEETSTPAGVVLSVNRRALEGASEAAARDMFSGDTSGDAIRRSRRPNKS